MKKLLTKTKLVEEPGSGGVTKSSTVSVEQLPSIKNPAASSNIQANSLIGKTCKLQTFSVIIEEVVAEGGFGVVFLAKNSNNSSSGKTNNKPFALKRIVVNNDADLGVAEKEIQVLSTLTKLGSPYLLPLLDYQTSKLTSDITEILSLTPFCKGSLLNVLNKAVAAKTPLLQQQVLRIFSDIVQGVECMHNLSTPIIHRDLKVENILEGGGIFLICDFGSATNKVWDPEVHSVGNISEELEKYTTVAYRAPEMVDLYSGRGPINTKSDVWALGVLVYKMCYWTTPFGDSILAIQSAKRLDFPSQPVYSLELQALINYMLLPDQVLRPDIYQVSELVHHLLEVPNPLVASKSSIRSWTIQEITDYFNQKTAALEQSSQSSAESVKKVPVAATVLETSVTPRQRPKASSIVQPPIPNVLGTPQAQPVGPPDSGVVAGQKVAVIMPPPKSPKPERKIVGEACFVVEGQQQPVTLGTLHGPASQSIPVMQSQVANNQAFPIPLAGDEASLPPAVASWNPFETDTFVAPSQGDGKDSNATDTDDDPFLNAPFNYYFKYQPMSQPFDFNTESTEDDPDLLMNDLTPSASSMSLNPFLTPEPILMNRLESVSVSSNLELNHQNHNNITVVKKAKGVTGISNYSFED